MTNNMLVPMPWQGAIEDFPIFSGYEWIEKLPSKRIWCALFQRWPDQDLPPGYDYYIVSFHLEVVDINWLKKQKVTGSILVLFDGNHYDLAIPGVYFLPFYYWHFQLQTALEWFGIQEKLQPTYKFSAVCNRISQSKLWITTKLLETAAESSLIVLNSWLEEKNVHGWQRCNNYKLDELMDVFRARYQGKQIKIDDFDNNTQNMQIITGNPWQPLYQKCAIHFTNESFHYSGMTENNNNYIWPGPFITEKTLKCLLGATAFVPVGQFETYKTLEQLGFRFEYGFDTAWDLDPGNLTRCESIVNLIDQLNQWGPDSLTSKTLESTRFNQNHIISGKFFQNCQKRNQESIEKIHNLLI